MKIFWRWLSFAVLAFGLGVIGAAVFGLVRILPSLYSAQISKNLDLASFISACATLLSGGATLVVVWIINYVYIARSSSYKADSDLLLESMAEVKASMGVLRDASRPCFTGKKLTLIEKSTLLSVERDLSNAVYSFARALDYVGIPVAVCDVSKLKDCRAELKDSLTDDPFPGPYSGPAQNRVSKAFRDMRDEMTRLSFRIIRR